MRSLWFIFYLFLPGKNWVTYWYAGCWCVAFVQAEYLWGLIATVLIVGNIAVSDAIADKEKKE